MRELTNHVAKEYPEQYLDMLPKIGKHYWSICEENQSEPDKVIMHTRENIYPAIAFYKAISEVTGDREQAYKFVADCLNKKAEKMSRVLRVLCKIPFIYRLAPGIMGIVIHKMYGKESGFEMKEYPKEKGSCHIDMNGCPYFSNCKKYGCPELTTAFCNSDDIAYGNLHPKLNWGRTMTLGRGNECCDFILKIR